MAVLYFDESWNIERIEWEIRRLNSEISAAQQHVKTLQGLLVKKAN